jgi:hypothetical protein
MASYVATSGDDVAGQAGAAGAALISHASGAIVV